MPEPITCPVCGLTSWHPDDVREGYCAGCHWWTSDPILAPRTAWVGDVHIVDVEVDEWTGIPPRLRPIERPKP